jgi:uncharacterized protein YheU (UPF0270 family)
MGKCLQVVHTFKQNITGGGSFEALAAGTGDSLAVPNFSPGSRSDLLEVWGGNSANACEFGIRSPDFHDNTRGLRMAYMFNPTLSGADGDPQLLLPPRIVQPLYASDVLTVEVNGTNTNNVALDFLAYYENLPGADQRLLGWPEVQARTVDNLGIRVSVTAGGTGDYGSNRTLNQDDDRLKANTDYAILGASSQLPCGLLAFTAPETSGRRIGLPLHWNEEISGDWFVWLSEKYGIDCIPVVNSNNKGNVIFQAADAAAGVATAATIIMAELR